MPDGLSIGELRPLSLPLPAFPFPAPLAARRQLTSLALLQGVQTGASGGPQVTIEGTDYSYPAGFGLNDCAAHSAALQPYCADSSGNPLSNRPDWCEAANQWCYIDPDYCTHANGNYMISSRSSYFPGASLYYSYGTCGGARNTFDAWTAGAGGTSCNQAEALGLVNTINGYVQTTAEAIERSYAEYSDTSDYPTTSSLSGCDDRSACPRCSNCVRATGWDSYRVDLTQANDRWRCGESKTSRDAKEMVCMARSIEGPWNQVAAKEYDDTSRVAFQVRIHFLCRV